MVLDSLQQIATKKSQLLPHRMKDGAETQADYELQLFSNNQLKIF